MARPVIGTEPWGTALNNDLNAIEATATAATAAATAATAAVAAIPTTTEGLMTSVLGGGGTFDVELNALFDPTAAAVRTLDKTSRDLTIVDSRRDAEWIPAQGFIASSGSPTLSVGGGSRFPVWALDDSVVEQVSCSFMVPAAWRAFWIDLYYANIGVAASGDISIGVTRSGVGEGVSLAAGDISAYPTIAAVGPHILSRSRLFSSTVPISAASLVAFHVRFSRDGAQGVDTLVGDMGVVGFMLRRAMLALKLVWDGNSLASGQGSTGGNTPEALTNALLTEPDTAARVQLPPVSANFGVGGQTTPAMTTDAVAQIDSTFAAVDTYTAQVLLAWEVTNDLYYGATAAAAFTAYRGYCLDRKAAGWKVLAFTVLPRTNAGTPGTFEADRQKVNALIRAQWPAFADGLVDVAADPLIGPPGASSNATYYGDLVHLTNAGYTIVAGLAAAAVQRLPGGN